MGSKGVDSAHSFQGKIVMEMLQQPSDLVLALIHVNQRLEQTELTALLKKAFGEFVKEIKRSLMLCEPCNLNSKQNKKAFIKPSQHAL